MQAVILAAGRGTRMKELSESVPKPMLKVAGKTLMEHKLDALPAEVDEVFIVVGYFGSVIHDYFGGVYGDKKLFYIEQEVLDGTAGALWRAKDILKGRFLVMMGDDIYSAEDIEKLVTLKDWAMAVSKSKDIQGGIVDVDKKHHIKGIIEGKHKGAGFAGTNLFGLDVRLFEYPMIPKAEGSAEFGLPQTIVAASEKSGIPFCAIEAHNWIQITSPEDIKKAEEILKEA